MFGGYMPPFLQKKRMKKLLLLASLFLCALSACKETSTGVDPEPTGSEISFTSEIFSASRVADNLFEAGDEITVAAFDSGEDMVGEALYSYTGSLFTSDEPIVKEEESSELTYVSFYPSAESFANEFSFSALPNQTTAEGYELSDLLVASTDATTDMQPMLTFKHKMSCLMMAFQLSDGTQISPSDVTILAKATAQCDLAADTFVANDNEETTMFTPMTYAEGSMKLIVAPQTIAQGNDFAEISYEGEVYTAYFDEDVELLSGWRYTHLFTIDVEVGEVTVEQIDATINDWEDDDMFSEPGDEPESDQMTLALKSATATDIIVTVGKGSYDGNYYLGLCDVSKYPGTPEAFAAELMDAEINTYGTDLSIVDDIWVFYEPGDVSMDAGWTFYPDSEYIVVAFGIDDNGNVMTNVPLIEVTTPPIVVSGTIDLVVNSVSSEGISITATPSEDVGNYVYGPLSTSVFESTYSSDETVVAEAIVTALWNAGVDFSTANGWSVLSGTKTFDCGNLWGLSAATAYTVFVFGVDEDGNITSEIATIEATTAEADPLPDPTDDFSAVLKEVGTSDIVVTVDKGSYEGNYYVSMMEKSLYDSNGYTPETLAEYFIDLEIYYHTNLANVDNRWVYYYNTDVSLRDGNFLVPDKEYIIGAFGIDDDGNILTNVATVVATTEHIDLVGTIDIEVTQVLSDNLFVQANPSEEVGNYLYGVWKDYEYESYFGGDALAASQNISYAYRFQGLKVSEADGKYVFNGPAEIEFYYLWYINPSTNYVVCIYGVDEYYMTTSEVAVVEVTTPATNYGAKPSYAEQSGLIRNFDSYGMPRTLKEKVAGDVAISKAQNTTEKLTLSLPVQFSNNKKAYR